MRFPIKKDLKKVRFPINLSLKKVRFPFFRNKTCTRFKKKTLKIDGSTYHRYHKDTINSNDSCKKQGGPKIPRDTRDTPESFLHGSRVSQVFYRFKRLA